MRTWAWVLFALCLAAVPGCGEPQRADGLDGGADASPGRDGGTPDGASLDGASLDGASLDDGSVDGSPSDPDAALDGSSPDVDASVVCEPVARATTLGTAVFVGSTLDAVHAPRASECPQSGPEELLAWTAPRTGYYRFDSISSRFDTVLSVRRTCDGTEVACNDDGAGIRSSLTIAASEGETLWIVIDGATPGSAGEYTIDVTEVLGPQCDAPGYSCHGSFFGWRLGYVQEGAAACAAPFGDAAFQLYDAADLVAGDQRCQCQCGAPRGGGCVAQLDCDGGSSCIADGTRDLSPSSCLPMTFGWDLTYACELTSPVPAGAGSCDSSVAETVHEAPTWSARARFCASDPAPSACMPFSATVCEPRVPTARTECIARTGTHSCPTPYAERTLFQAGLFTDTRRCDEGSCGCGPAAVTSCECAPSGGCRASFYTSDLCSDGTLVASVPVGACTTIHWLSSIHSGRAALTGATPQLEDCAVTGASAPAGTVRAVPENVITVCCKVVD